MKFKFLLIIAFCLCKYYFFNYFARTFGKFITMNPKISRYSVRIRYNILNLKKRGIPMASTV